MTPEQTFGQLQGIGKSWRVFEARLGPEFSVVVPEVQETPGLWPEKSARAAIPVVCCDNVESMQWQHLSVFNQDWVIVSVLPRGRRGDDERVPSVPVGGAQQAHHPEVRGLRFDPA